MVMIVDGNIRFHDCKYLSDVTGMFSNHYTYRCVDCGDIWIKKYTELRGEYIMEGGVIKKAVYEETPYVMIRKWE